MMSEQREKVRCRSCELMQWNDRSYCRRCGETLPQPAVQVVERVVERIVVRPCVRCGESTASEPISPTPFPTMAEVERRMILAAHERSNRKPLEAARLLGIGKTTMYRKLRLVKLAA
jgi:transcriptional regulator of acetoin/glycerol metabolism